ncbi:helix-turn-helix transcriptional regulator [Photobacterium sp. CCB-ST2H9]|uniref:winged helix-turn-helix transcriptional regulator n=1 Tax=Photobacterium sp. CCB-ST2H9 TaxID=2912855 RepID=UPI002006D2D8|nr:helix-turn-helix domain-containing protein [Photobacterium sp. CCB-ST2H9]UTM59744.1 helix-turn-helix transcriptional regulator [Photobacterium sp. CCB-ST2H9]
MGSSVKTDTKGRKIVLNECKEPCSVEKGMRLIGGKWKGTILYHLKDGPVRFNDLARMLGGASKKMIDQRLKELESEDMVVRKVISDRPIAVSYELTEFGRSALDILEQIRLWSEKYNVGEKVKAVAVSA